MVNQEYLGDQERSSWRIGVMIMQLLRMPLRKGDKEYRVRHNVSIWLTTGAITPIYSPADVIPTRRAQRDLSLQAAPTAHETSEMSKAQQWSEPSRPDRNS